MALVVSSNPNPLPEEGASETQLTDWVVKEANRHSWFVHAASSSKNPSNGFPQFMLLKNGRVSFVEVLGPKKSLSANQKAWFDRLQPVVVATNSIIQTFVVRNRKEAERFSNALRG